MYFLLRRAEGWALCCRDGRCFLDGLNIFFFHPSCYNYEATAHVNNIIQAFTKATAQVRYGSNYNENPSIGFFQSDIYRFKNYGMLQNSSCHRISSRHKDGESSFTRAACSLGLSWFVQFWIALGLPLSVYPKVLLSFFRDDWLCFQRLLRWLREQYLSVRFLLGEPIPPPRKSVLTERPYHQKLIIFLDKPLIPKADLDKNITIALQYASRHFNLQRTVEQ